MLNPTQAYSTFHPMEVIRFSWSAVPDAVSYVLDAAEPAAEGLPAADCERPVSYTHLTLPTNREV